MKRTMITLLTLALAPAMFAAPQSQAPKSTAKASVVSPIPATDRKGPAPKATGKSKVKGKKGTTSPSPTGK